MEVPLLRPPYEDWECPNCDMTERLPAMPPGASRFHTCPGLHMLTAPLVRATDNCKVEAVDREDYVGREVIHQADDGRAYMSVRTTYADGHEDLAVNAPVAQGRMGDW